MGVRTCFGGKMSHLACVFIRGRDWRKNGRNDIDCYTFFGSSYSILFFKEHGDEEKMDCIWFIRVNGMHHTV